MRKNLPILIAALISLSCNDAVVKEKKSGTSTDQKVDAAGQNNAAAHVNKINAVNRVNNIDISYDECGKGDTTLLFVHGWCINKEYWEDQKKYFCDNYKVVTLDLPGFGKSGKTRTDWSFDQYANDINEFIKTANLKNVILIGHSMSGDILLLMDTKYPNSIIGIVGIDNLKSPGDKNTEAEKEEIEGFLSMLEKDFSGTVEGYTKQNLFTTSADPSIVKRVMNDFKMSDSVIATKVLRSLADVSQKEREMMQQLTHKLYLINSDTGPTKIETLIKYCKAAADVVYVNGTGHYPMIEKPAEFNTALEKVIWMIGNKLQPRGGQ
jgi:pimeloyl-ACP methyl ester carboxylesterase